MGFRWPIPSCTRQYLTYLAWQQSLPGQHGCYNPWLANYAHSEKLKKSGFKLSCWNFWLQFLVVNSEDWRMSWNWNGELSDKKLINTLQKENIFNVGKLSTTYPMARRVRSQAIKAVACAAERLSLRNTRTWWVPEKTEASPTIEAIKASGTK